MTIFFMEAIILASLVFAGAAPTNSAATGDSALLAQSSSEVSFSRKEIDDVIAGPRDMMRLNRFGGLLNDLLREQKTAFVNAGGNAKNDVAIEVENLMNDANWSASQDKYEKGFKSLEKAYRLMVDSINQLTKRK